jgi:multidrug efflux pump
MDKPDAGEGGFNLSRWAIEHGSFTRFIVVLLMISGVFAYLNLGQKEDPEFTFRIMVVRAYWPGATATEMEQQVTDRIEEKLQETPYLDRTQSYSKPGETQVFVFLREDTPPKEVRNVWYQVRKKVGDVRGQLPQGVQGPFFNDEFGDTYIAMYAFHAEGFSYTELKDYVDSARKVLGARIGRCSSESTVATETSSRSRTPASGSARRRSGSATSPRSTAATKTRRGPRSVTAARKRSRSAW